MTEHSKGKLSVILLRQRQAALSSTRPGRTHFDPMRWAIVRLRRVGDNAALPLTAGDSTPCGSMFAVQSSSFTAISNRGMRVSTLRPRSSMPM